jgi:hypothetical protein
LGSFLTLIADQLSLLVDTVTVVASWLASSPSQLLRQAKLDGEAGSAFQR